MHDRRQEPRNNTEIKVNCRVDGSTFRTRVFNFSNNGCQIELPAHSVMLGDRLLLELNRRLVFPATVRWSLDGRAGLEFSTPQHGLILKQLHASWVAKNKRTRPASNQSPGSGPNPDPVPNHF